jgi:replication-associated recombination protein RarA
MSEEKAKKWEPHLIGNYQWDEVVSSLQKMIRRGKEYEACFWAYVLVQSGFGAYLWRRLSIICCEDIGNGDPTASILVSSLTTSWERLQKHNKLPSLDKFLLFVQAILYMCRTKKSREDDSLVNLIDGNWKNNKRLEIPTIALDSHTGRGREKFGRFGDKSDGKEKLRIENWFSIWAKIENKAYSDKWEQEWRDIWIANAL